MLRLFFFVIALYISFFSQNIYSQNIPEKEPVEQSNQPAEDQLINREILFGNPENIAVRLSPNGEYISFLAPKDGVMNIWVAPKNDIKAARAITSQKERGIRGYFWAHDNKHVIYAQDQKGDENWRLYSVNVVNAEEKVLTKEGARASVLKISEKYSEEILIEINDRVAEYFDIYKINLNSGSKELIYENKAEFASFLADDNFAIRIGYKMLPSGESELYLFEDQMDLSKYSLFDRFSAEDMLNTSTLHIASDGNTLYMIDSRNRDTSALVEVDLSTNNRTVLYSNDKADLDDYMADPKDKLIEAVAVNYLRKNWQFLDAEIEADFLYLSSLQEGDIEVVSRTSDDNKWVVAFLLDNGPVKYYLYDRMEGRADFLVSSNSKQENLPFAHMYPVVIKARDGLDLVSYLTTPRWLDQGNGKVASPLPMVLYVHGGPNARDEWGYNPVHQWLANRGYAVLSVNYRGSTGFGKGFINAGDGQWARKMQDDLVDALNWAVAEGIADKDKVAIVGGSYGGYATLVGMTMTPDLFACGIDIVGPSNLETLLRSIPPYWKPMIAHLNKIIGASVDTEEGRALLAERSPLTYAKDIKKPLMIVQGANDPRVKQAESDQIVEMMKKHSIPVTYLLYPDEGHGLARPENRFSYYAFAEEFLAQFLGGRLIPHDGKFPGSNLQVKEKAVFGR